MNTKRKPTSPKSKAPASSAESCPVAALMRPAALLLKARDDAIVLKDDYISEQAADAFESLVSLIATRQATSLVGAAFQLLIGCSRVDDMVCGQDLKTRERAHRDAVRLLASAYDVVVAAEGIAPDEIIVDHFLGCDSASLPPCIEAAFAAPPGDSVKVRLA